MYKIHRSQVVTNQSYQILTTHHRNKCVTWEISWYYFGSILESYVLWKLGIRHCILEPRFNISYSLSQCPLPAFKYFFSFDAHICSLLLHVKARKTNGRASPIYDASVINKNILWPYLNRIDPPGCEFFKRLEELLLLWNILHCVHLLFVLLPKFHWKSAKTILPRVVCQSCPLTNNYSTVMSEATSEFSKLRESDVGVEMLMLSLAIFQYVYKQISTFLLFSETHSQEESNRQSPMNYNCDHNNTTCQNIDFFLLY